MAYNKHKQTSESFGGLVPLWVDDVSPRVESGGLIVNTTLVDGEILSGGTPVEYNHDTKAAKLLKSFKVKSATVDGTNTIVTIYRNDGKHVLNVGENIMVAPSTVAGTGKGVLVSAVDNSVAYETTFTVVTANFDAVTTGTILVQAAGAGASVQMYAIPTDLTHETTEVGDQNYVGVVIGLKYLYKQVAPYYPQCVLDLFGQSLKFATL